MTLAISTGFPVNVVNVIAERFQELLPGTHEVIQRALRPTDPNRCLGIYSVDWTPDIETMEIGGPLAPPEPTIQTYAYRIQNLIKHTDEVEGRALYAWDAKMVRAVLYRDQDLRVRLTAIQETVLGSVERLKRVGVRNQRFLNNELQGQFLYLATTEFWVETENVPVPS